MKFVSVNNRITLCELCAQIHKNFGYQISYLRSIEDKFDDYLMHFFIYGGNKKFRKALRHIGVNLDIKKPIYIGLLELIFIEKIRNL